MQSSLTILKFYIDKNVNVETENDKQYINSLFHALSNPFIKIKTKHLCLKKLEDVGVLVRPVKNVIGHKFNNKLHHGKIILEPKDVQAYSIPLRVTMKKILEHSNFLMY